ncbi:MAG TPA: hypothetical protein VMW54_04750 [Terriglobia bacterium]|nr:hypothetical protein [Terriglobia bacterium]
MLQKSFCRLALFIVIFAWVSTTLAAAAGTAASGLSDSGTFRISVAGKEIGTERFRILPSGNNIIAKADIEFQTQKAGKLLELQSFPELLLDSRLRPLSYTWAQKGAQNSKLRIDFTTAPVKAQYHTVNGKNDERDFALPADVVVLDDNALDQYEILVALYDKTSGGQQTFNAFIPQEALPGQVQVVATGNEQVRIGGESESLRHFVVATDLARIDLWTDPQGHLERVSVPAMRFNAIRQK